MRQERELEILKFWKENKIFEKLRVKNSKGKRWSFIDGPVTANNPMGVHHAWGRTYKDLFQRFKAMQGFNQRWQNGFDCQGLWIEVEVEKEKGFKCKKDIEAFGIANFVEACKERTERMAKLITEQSIRLGQWMDWENSYYTHSFKANDYKWFFIKYCYEKGWLYKGIDVVPWCPRCEAVESKHGLATEGYAEREDKAVYVKFPVKNHKGESKEFFLVWTTTPWTLPANVAIAVNPEIFYVRAKKDDEIFILAENLAKKVLGDFEIIGKVLGKDLEGMQYEMPYKDLEPQKASIVAGSSLESDEGKKVPAPHKVVLWSEVSSEEGTGIVHIAPGCGPEDYQLGIQYKLPAISPLDSQGRYIEGYDWLTGKYAFEANEEIIKDLKKRKFLFKEEKYKHSYPHCTRCHTPVVFRLVPEWYISMKEIRKKLIEANEKIRWIPEFGKFYEKNWLESMGDWLFSRKRYYGLAMPIWECENCKAIEVIGSAKELKKKAIKGIEHFTEHRKPGVDKVLLKCKKCGSFMHRVPDTVDVWMDAALVPFYTLDWLKNKKYFNQWYPADLVIECGPGQYRLWFFFMLLAGVVLTGKPPFKNVFTYELVKDAQGREMHKSLGNAVWIDEAIEKIGADALRYLYVKASPHKNLCFSFDLAKDAERALKILENVGRYVLENLQPEVKQKKLQPEDLWLLSRLNSSIEEATKNLEEYKPDFYLKAVENFLVSDLSRTYIQIVRERVQQKSETRDAALYTLCEAYLTVLRLLAPTIPFTTEYIFQQFRKKLKLEESIHLCEWPKADKKKINKKLEEKFDIVKKIIEKALAQRSKSQISLRWPLKKVKIETNVDLSDLLDIIKKQVNVKEVEIKKTKTEEPKVELETEMTKELEEEGYLREITRLIQEARKKAALKKGQLIGLQIKCDNYLENLIKKNEKDIKEKVNASSIKFEKGAKLRLKKMIKDHEIEIYF
ncbi:MAG: isoleucine--tRNA ligase [Candidatus Pacearchaeota archaeon]